MTENLNFQYCQKIVVFDKEDRVLLAKRKGEADYDGTFSFIGGKMEVADGGILEGVRREKQEEIGHRAILLAAPHLSFNVYFTKSDGSAMILPHLYAEYVDGPIELNEEYSEYQWVPIADIDNFEPKIETIPSAIKYAKRLQRIITPEDLSEI